jgi:predicted RNA-binding protein (virulence factor B family)
MYDIGRINTLQIHHIDDDGVWLKAGPHRVLLPATEVNASMKEGDRVEAFLYQNSSGDLAATLNQPKAQVGEFALLKVSAVTRHGAFLDWGLDKDLLVPYSEQPERMRVGRNYIVRVYLDDQGRTVATARIDHCLEKEKEKIDLCEGQEVDLLLWEYTDLGAKVIINHRYGGLLYRDDLMPGQRRGDRFRGYIKRLREDQKIDVSLRRGGVEEVKEAQQTILEALDKEGFLPLHDKSSPLEIKQLLGMSKKLFKKAVGGLYKNRKVELADKGIRRKD